MSPTGAQTFYIDIRGFGWSRAWLFLLPFAVVVYLLWPHYYLALALGLVLPLTLAISLILGMAICTIVVRGDGIVIYRITALHWDDIHMVERRSYLGLPYLYIERTSGARGVWLPLYLRHAAGFHAAVRAKAPPGNALRGYAESIQAPPIQTAGGA